MGSKRAAKGNFVSQPIWHVSNTSLGAIMTGKGFHHGGTHEPEAFQPNLYRDPSSPSVGRMWETSCACNESAGHRNITGEYRAGISTANRDGQWIYPYSLRRSFGDSFSDAQNFIEWHIPDLPRR